MDKKTPVFNAAMTAVIMMIAVLAFAAPRGAMAYAIAAPSPGSFSGIPVNVGNPGGATGGYNFGSSIQNLLAPFTGFLNNLRGTTTINTNGAPGYTPPSDLNMSGSAPQIQSVITGWLTEFDNWVYANTGIRLSGIVYVFLNILQWVLNLAIGIVNWLLGLFRGA